MNFFPARSAALNAFDLQSPASIVPPQDQGSLTVPGVGLGRASQSLLFIDGGVQDYSQLVAGVAAGTEVYILDPVQDAVTQITQALLGRAGISSLHIVSHGESGGLDFGASRLNLTELPGYAAQLQSWGQALTADADILLYGCDVASGELGQAFVQILSQLTGADVAASDDLTGSGALGGDWTLEFNTGQIESGLAFSQSVRDAYTSILPTFAATNLGVRTTPISVATGDFNGDGVADIVAANSGANTVSVLLGTGTGSFGAKTDFTVGSAPYSVATGDFNGDGKADIVASNLNSNNVSVLLGDGTGGFGAKTDFSAATRPYGIAVGDFNGDGKADIVTTGNGSNYVSVQLGTGTGSFGAVTNFTVGSGPVSLAIADFNRDGKADIAVANYSSSSVSVLLGTGTGSFGTATDFAVGANARSLAIGDFNGDGQADIVAANNGSNTVSVLLGTGTGSFGTATNFTVGSGPISVGIGDFNGDGKADIATANYTSNTVSVLSGTGTGSFGPKTDFAVGGTNLFSVAIADFNRDGKADIVAVNAASNTVSVLLNTSPRVTVAAGINPSETGTTGTFTLTLDQPAPTGGLTVNFAASGTATRPADYSFSAGSNITSVSATSFVIAAGATSATLNVVAVSDGIADPNETVTLTLAAGNDYFLGSNPTAQFTAPTNYGVGNTPRTVATGDFNGDGKIDLVVTNDNSNTVSVLLGSGTGSLGTKTDFTVGALPYAVATGDFNGDGKIDLAVANRSSNTVSVLLGNGTGGFGVKTDFAVGTTPQFVAIGDFNGDGKADVVTANAGSNNVSVLLGNGTGGFGAVTNFATGTNSRGVAIGDFNGDGNTDVVTANYDSNTVSVLLGDGTGGFGVTNFTVGANPISVAVGDFNGDGKTDIVAANNNAGVSVLLGTGTGSFGTKTDFAVGANPHSVTVGDFNGDGKADIVVANINSNNVSVLLGTGTGSFGAATNLAAGRSPTSVVAGDFNGDGKSDLAVANIYANTVSVLLNAPPSATLTIADAPTVSLSTIDSTAAETGGDTGLYRISRTTTTGDLIVNLTLSGSASPSDYSFSSNVTVSGSTVTVTIPNGQSSVDITLSAIDDIQAEAAETIALTLATGTYTIGTATPGTVTIAQNDFVVTNTNNAGEGSLRQAILNANAIAGDDTISFAGSTFTDAAADTIGLTSGELEISSNVVINGTGANLLTVSGNNASRVFTVNAGATVTLNSLTIANGNAVNGSGINNQGNLTVNNSSFSGNYASYHGAGIWSDSILTVNNTSFTGNSANASTGRGVIFNSGGTVTVSSSSFTGATLRDGGGIFNNSGSLTVNSSSFTNNQSNGGGGVFNALGTATLNNITVSGNRAYGWGAGLWNAPGAIMILNNSTVSGNSSGVGGGGIWNEGGNLAVNNSTLTNNSAGSYGGGIWSSGTVSVGNSIIAGNRAGTGPEVSIGGGTLTSKGYNLVGQNGSAGGFTTIATDIVLAGAIGTAIGSLANNGGPTQTHALVAGSAAINAGSNALVPPGTSTDQRGTGFDRVIGGNVDIGAVESSFKATVTLTASDPNAAESGSNTGTYRISRNSTAGNLTVKLNLSGGPDLNSTDYTLSGGSLTIAGNIATIVIPTGQSFVDLTFTAVDDIQAEAAESLTLDLIADATYSLGSTTTGAVTITQNDFVVINTNNAGEGSLRQAILNANAIAGDDTITFAGPTFTDATADTIGLTSAQLDINSNITINGTGANLLTVSGNNAFRVFNITSGTVSLDGMTIANGNGGANGGGINNSGILTINNSAVTGNRADRGGGIINASTLTLNNSTLSGNSATINGGGIYNGQTGVLTLNNSTLSGNSSVENGGGIFNSSDVSNGQVTVNNSTLTGNSAGTTGGGIWSSGKVMVGNSIVAGNTASDGAEVYRYPYSGESFTSKGYNLVGQNGSTGGFTTVATDIVLAGTIDTNLSALGNYGGPTQTHALLPGSAAIDAAGPGATGVDQRGIDAVGTRDIGAFESRGFSITAIGGTPQTALRATAFTAPLVATVSSAFGEPVNGGTVTFTAPNTGASTTVTSQTATIAAGQVSINETANNTAGTYDVIASANGIATPANFSLTNANTRPVVTNVSKTGLEDNAINFASADFSGQFSDANRDSLTKIQITTLPTQGSLQLAGSTVSLNQEITLAQLSTLSYVPNPNSNGPDSFGWNGSDGTDYAATSATVNLTIAPVNDAPSFTKGANQTAIAGSSVRTVINWATNFIPGPSDEAGQTVQQYQIVSNSNPGLFAVQPAIDSTGKLTYTPVRTINSPQTATLILQVKDNGGIDNGGIDTSATQSFTITVNPRICPVLTVFQSQHPKLSKSSQRLLASQPPALRQLFDEEFYLRQNRDVALAVVRGSFLSGFEHFLRYGQYEGRDPSGLYNERHYLSQNSDVAAAVSRGHFRSGFQHFLRYGEYEGRNASTLYNEQTYLAENPDVAAAVARGNFRSGLQHFLQHGFAEGRVPHLTLFNERYYLSQNPDVATAVSRGRFKSGFEHFERFGQFEGRQPSTLFNERYYLSQNPDVAAAVSRGRFKSGFEHFLDFGRFEGRAGVD